MNIRGGLTVALLASVALSGCKLGGVGAAKAPTGQVVATVGDREITVRELESETQPIANPDPRARKAAQMGALENIVVRTVLAKAAVEQGLDKTPQFALTKQRAIDTILAQSLQAKIAGQVPKITKEDAERFVSEHPDIFAQRKVFEIDQIRMARPNDPTIIKKLEPLKTLPDIEALLTLEKIPYQRSVGNLDAVGADPRMIDTIMKLPPNEVFVIPSNDAILVNQIKSTKIVPFAGPQSIEYATQVLARQRTQEAVSRQISALYGKAKPTVRFSKDYTPPAAPTGPATPLKK